MCNIVQDELFSEVDLAQAAARDMNGRKWVHDKTIAVKRSDAECAHLSKYAYLELLLDGFFLLSISAACIGGIIIAALLATLLSC